MKKKQNVIVEYSSYSRTILADLKSLSKLIRKYSATQQDNTKTREATWAPLKLEQIQNALLNPQNALKPSMVAFATLLKTEQEIIKTQERIQVQRESIRESIQGLKEQHVISKDTKEKEKLFESSKKMENMLRKTGEIYQGLVRFQETLKERYREIDALALKHDKEWHEYRTFYLRQTLNNLLVTDLDLSDMERQALLSEDTWPQILQDFQTLNIDIPEDLNVSAPNFETYFKLKAYLAVHSSLSRRMLPHKTADVLKYVKKILKK
ncbi:MAG: putative cytosolic protein [Gammaproteobacteria bacterium]|jgi:hypothetical protein|nr:putative cytosolic protein [Gammaproteobacteria bacterium]